MRATAMPKHTKKPSLKAQFCTALVETHVSKTTGLRQRERRFRFACFLCMEKLRTLRKKQKHMVIYGIIWVWFCFLRFLYACESCGGNHDKPLRSTCILHLRGALECAVCLDEWRDKLSQTRLFLQGRITPQIMVYTII